MNAGMYYAAAGTTAAAGILHLLMVPTVIPQSLSAGIFFGISGIAQLFWILPMIRRWGRAWYYVGIGGTVVLIILWAVTRVPNPILGFALPVDIKGVAIKVLEAGYIALTAIIIAKVHR